MRSRSRLLGAPLAVVAALACTRAVEVTGDYPVVESSVTTAPCHSRGDACDDSAIWIHPADPAESVVIGDDKDGGMLVWDLEGREIQFLDREQKMNNVDLRYEFPLDGTFSTGQRHARVALVGVVNETAGGVTFYKVNPYSSPPGTLEHANATLAASTIPLGKPLPYGGCMYHSPLSGSTSFFANWKDGTVVQVALTGGRAVAGSVARTFDVGGQVEGCVADDVHGALYIGEEDVGIWRYGAEADAGAARTAVDTVGSSTGLVADVEGLALYYRGDGGGYLIASGQSTGPDVRNVVYAREAGNAWVGTFRVAGSDETDGLDVTNFPLGSGFPHGVLVTHDAAPTPSRHRLTPFERVAAALHLTTDPSWDPRCAPYGTCAPRGADRAPSP